MLKYSRQRESIKQYLDVHRTHPTAEMVYSDMKKDFPNISLGTVYRNLNLLADMGEILRLSDGNGPDRFDGNTSPHYHFTCTSCNRVLDLEMKPSAQLEKKANASFDGIITNHTTHFFGLCPECKNIKYL